MLVCGKHRPSGQTEKRSFLSGCKRNRITGHLLHGVVHLLCFSLSQGLLQGAQVKRVWVLHPGYLIKTYKVYQNVKVK